MMASPLFEFFAFSAVKLFRRLPTVPLARIDRELRAELELRRQYAICGLPSPHQPGGNSPEGALFILLLLLLLISSLSGRPVI